MSRVWMVWAATVAAATLSATSAAAAAAAVTELRICVVLGVDNRTRAASGSAAGGNDVGRALTSDQEQWAALQSAIDIEAELAAAGSPFRLKLDTLFAGDDADSDAAKVAIASFAANCSANGAGAFVGGYMSDRTLLALQPRLLDLGLAVLMPASGLPVLPPPRQHVLRFWPSDAHQADAVVAHIDGAASAAAAATVARADGVVVLSRNDITGQGLANAFVASLGATRLRAPVQFYDGSGPASAWLAKLPVLKNAIATTRSHGASGDALGNGSDTRVAFFCNCGPEEIASILDGMRALGWPSSRTAMVLSDRSTPTRSVVADPLRAKFAESVQLSGVLSAVASDENPVFTALQTRWAAEGHTTSMFASSSCLYDVIQIAATASMLAGGGNTTARPAHPGGQEARPGFVAATWSAALRAWGATGAMALSPAGDLFRATYDVYAVTPRGAWAVVGRIDARALQNGATF